MIIDMIIDRAVSLETLWSSRTRISQDPPPLAGAKRFLHRSFRNNRRKQELFDVYSKLVKAADLTRRTHSGTSIGRPAWSVWHCPVRSRNATCTLPSLPLLPPTFLSVEVEVFGRVVSEVTNPTRNSPLNLSLAFSGPSSPRSSPARHFSLLFPPSSSPLLCLSCFPYFV